MTTKEIEEKPKWLNKVDLNRSEANRMMKIAKELPNYSTLGNLGSTASTSYPSSKTTTKSFNVERFIKIAEEFPNFETLRNLETSEHRENAKKPRRSASAIISIILLYHKGAN